MRAPVSVLSRKLTFGSALLFFCVVCMCNAGAGSPPRYRLSISDRPNQQRFVIALHSLDKRALAVYCYRWPNKRGEIGSPWVTLESSEGIFKAHGVNFGLTGPEGNIRIEPGSTITAFIGYEQFDSADRVVALHHRKLQIDKKLWSVVLCPPESSGCFDLNDNKG